MNDETRKKASTRLKRIAGQIAGIQRMLEGDRHCVDLLVQVAAVQSALLETGRVILAGHLESCLTDASRSRDPRERRRRLDELMTLFSRFLRVDEADGASREIPDAAEKVG